MGRVLLKAALVATLLLLQRGQGAAQPAPKASVCTKPEYHQFDFFVGDWDAFNFDKPDRLVAHNRVEPILDGCVILEGYEDTSGHHGESFSVYDATKQGWHQTWVTNRGELLLLDGEFRDGEMILSGHDIHNGKKRDVRGVWRVEGGGVRETAAVSFDGGKTWEPWFDLMFRAHKK